MAKLTTAHTDPDEAKAQEALDRAHVVMTDKANEISSSVRQITFLDSVVDFMLGQDASAIASGAASLGATPSVAPAMLGTGTVVATPPAGVVDYYAIGQAFANDSAAAGFSNPQDALAWMRDLLHGVTLSTTTGNLSNAETVKKGLAHVSKNFGPSDFESDGTPKIVGRVSTLTTERDDAKTAKSTAETALANAVTAKTTAETAQANAVTAKTTAETERDAAKTKLTTIKTAFTAVKDEINGSGRERSGVIKGVELKKNVLEALKVAVEAP